MELSAEEAAKYDRQIRLWGVEAQKRMRSSKVLIAGMSALGAEIAKNITLAGVNTTITDTTVASAADLSGNFFLCETGLGQNVSTQTWRARCTLPLAALLRQHTAYNHTWTAESCCIVSKSEGSEPPRRCLRLRS